MPEPHETAVDEFAAADQEYQQLQNYILSGEAVVELTRTYGQNPSRLQQEWQTLIEQLKSSLEERNSKLRSAKDEMRRLVQIDKTRQRGPNGTAETRTYGPLVVRSTTHRTFDAAEVLRLASEHGIEERILTLTAIGEDGQPHRLLEQVWQVDYQNLYQWLNQNGYHNIINASYDEKEKTPAVSGAKPLAWLGEKIEK